MKKLIFAVIAALALSVGVAAAQTAGMTNHLPSAPYTYSEAGG